MFNFVPKPYTELIAMTADDPAAFWIALDTIARIDGDFACVWTTWVTYHAVVDDRKSRRVEEVNLKLDGFDEAQRARKRVYDSMSAFMRQIAGTELHYALIVYRSSLAPVLPEDYAGKKPKVHLMLVPDGEENE